MIIKNRILLLALIVLLSPMTARAASSVPHTINLQSMVFDAEGKVTTSESVDMTIRILDADNNVLFTEAQNGVVAVKGAINVNIGESSGGVPLDILDPSTGMKLIDVEIAGQSPFELMPLGALPYAMWAEKALTVSNDSVGSEQIINGSIKVEDLSPIEFANITGMASEDQIPGTITRNTDLEGHIAATAAHPASAIVVSGNFVTFVATNVQEALKELDAKLLDEIVNRQAGQTTLTTNLGDEVAARTGADTTLQSNINTAQTTANTAVTNAAAAQATANTAVSNAATAQTTANGAVTAAAAAQSTADAAVSAAGALPPIGTIIPFYDFGGALTFDAIHWAYCDGSAVTIAGIGPQTLPDLSNRYLVGFGTEGGGDIDSTSWGTAVVGNASHQINLEHSHTVNTHNHSILFADLSDAEKGIHSHGGRTNQMTTTWGGNEASTDYRIKDDSPSRWGNKVAMDRHLSVDTGGNDEGQHDHNIDYDGSHSHGGVTGSVSPGTDNQLSTSQSIQPRSVRVRFIMRIK